MDKEILLRVESTVRTTGTRNEASGVVEIKGDTVELIMTLVACMKSHDELRVLIQAAAITYSSGMGPNLESAYVLET